MIPFTRDQFFAIYAVTADAREEEEILYPAAVLVGRYVTRTAPK